jgi:hypothetical protein
MQRKDGHRSNRVCRLATGQRSTGFPFNGYNFVRHFAVPLRPVRLAAIALQTLGEKLMKSFVSTAATLCRGGFVVCSLLCMGLVNAGQGRYVVSGDGQEVTDTQTKLVWQRCTYGQKWDGNTCSGKPIKVTFAQAKKLAADAGAQWRVPHKEELVSLLERKGKKTNINKEAFPNTTATIFWADRPDKNDNLNAWLVDFRNGHVLGNSGEAKFLIRLTRAS